MASLGRCLSRLALLSLALLLLSGCLLLSGESTTVDLQAGGGNLLTSFVGAEGRSERTLDLGLPAAEVQVIAIVGVESGDIELAMLQPDGSLAFAIASRPETQVTYSGTVRTNDEGRLRYAIKARGARHGSLQIFVQP